MKNSITGAIPRLSIVRSNNDVLPGQSNVVYTLPDSHCNHRFACWPAGRLANLDAPGCSLLTESGLIAIRAMDLVTVGSLVLTLPNVPVTARRVLFAQLARVSVIGFGSVTKLLLGDAPRFEVR